MRLNGKRCPITQLHEEWKEEAGGRQAQLDRLNLWAVRCDPFSNTRYIPLSRATDGQCSPELSDLTVRAFCEMPEMIYTALVFGDPAPIPGPDAEAERCEWIDTRGLVITEREEDSRFGVQHDLVLAVYRWGQEGKWHLTPSDFLNTDELRQRLLKMQ